MRKVITSVIVLVGVLITVALQSAGAATKTSFTSKFLGAQVSKNENVYDVRGNPRGAAIQIFKNNAKLTAGTSKTTGYYGVGILVSKESYTLSKANAKGIITIKGTGHFVSGTGIYKHVKGSFKFTGTTNVKTLIVRITITGTISL